MTRCDQNSKVLWSELLGVLEVPCELQDTTSHVKTTTITAKQVQALSDRRPLGDCSQGALLGTV